MWQSTEKLMGRGHVQANSSLTVDDSDRFFIDKVAKVRDSTEDAPTPFYNAVPPGFTSGYFRLIDRDDVIKQIVALLDRQCTSERCQHG